MKIDRKKIIVGTFVVVLILVAVWFFGILNKNEQDELINETKNLFPFGKILNNTGISNNGNQNTTGGYIDQETGEFIPEIEEVTGPRLRQITDFPTGGFAALIKKEDKEITDISINSTGESSQIIKTIKVNNPYVRYASIDDATIFESKLTPSSITKELIIQNYIPNTEHILFSKDGNNILFQYWNNEERTAETYLGLLTKKEFTIPACPYNFTKKITVGDENINVLNIHEFLNKNPQTRIAVTGINSPGNEASLATELTITAIKNFQSLYALDIDGQLGTSTQKKMLDLCNEEQTKIAKEKFDALETKYEISGSFLPQGITTISVKPSGDEFFYIQEDALGVVGVVRNFLTGVKKTVFQSPYTEWISQWNNENNIELTTKSSFEASGYSYYLDPKDGDYHKSFKQRRGLTTLTSPDNEKIFVQEVENENVKNSVYDRKSGISRNLSIQTFSEKCVWSDNSLFIYCAVPDTLAYGNEYPDMWYQGMETYNDSLWRINTISFQEEIIADIPSEYNENIDIFKIGVDRNAQYLYFIDKNTEYLWSYRLEDI